MKLIVRAGVVGALAVGFALAAQPDALALNDTAPPTVASYTVVPNSVSVTQAGAFATVVLRIRDTDGLGNAGSGFATGSLTLSNGTNVLDPIDISPSDRVSGTATDGTYDINVFLPQGTPGGSYTATDITLDDVFGSGPGHYTNATVLTVARTPDTTAPALVGSIVVSAPSVNVTSASAQIIYTVHITDAVSGVSQVSLDLTGPLDEFGDPQTATLFFDKATGTANDGTWTAVRQYNPTDTVGSWTATTLHLTDGYGNAANLASPSGGAVNVTKTVDSTPPAVGNIQVNPTSVNTTDGSATVTVTIPATDATSGIQSGFLTFTSPSESENVFAEFQGAPTTGTNKNGSWVTDVAIPLRSEAGTWTLSAVSILDNQENQLDLVTGDAGLPIRTFSVTTAPDAAGPVLSSFTLGPATVTTAYDNNELIGRLHYTDAVSGLDYGTITFRDPTNTVSNDIEAFLYDSSNDGGPGTGHSGDITFFVFVPSNAAVGTWTVNAVELIDRAGNTSTYTTAQLSGAGYPTTFTVNNTAADTQAPNLTALSFSPTSLNTTTGEKSATLTAAITDPDANASGLESAHAELLSPSHDTSIGIELFTSVTGNSKTGTWSGTATIPQYTESGIWTISSVSLFDRAGHERFLQAGDLATAGLTTTLQVTAAADTVAPTLTGVTLDTPSINTATTTELRFHIAATDATSGVDEVTVSLSGPGGRTITESAFPDTPAPGVNLEVDLFVPVYNSGGSWTTSAITVFDAVGNAHLYTAADLASLGFSRTASVTALADVTAPAASGLKLTPTPVDTTAGPVAADVLVHLTDARAGVWTSSITVTSPHLTQSLTGALSLINGTGNDGWYQASLGFPKFVDAGTWTVAFTATDNEGNVLTLTSAQLISAGMPGTLTVTGPPDPNPAAVTGLTITPNNVANTSPHTITFTVTATDAESGVAGVSIDVNTPTGNEEFNLVDFTRTAGNAANGTYTGVYQLPTWAAPGSWSISHLFVDDVYGNHRSYTAAQLTAAGATNTSFLVTGTADTTGPALTALTLTPTTVDVSGGASSVGGTVSATDAQAGVSSIGIEYTSPNGLNTISAFADVDDRTSGTIANPTMPFMLNVPQYAQPGDWTLSGVSLVDQIGNERNYTAGNLPPSGITTVLHVIDTNPDLVAPALVNVSAPPTLDVHLAPGNLSVTLHLTDAASGVASGTVYLRSPSQQDERAQSFTSANRTGGTAADGTYAVSFPFTPATESGNWSIRVSVADVAGNSTTYSGVNVPGTSQVAITGTPAVPAAPTNVFAIAGNQKAFLSWNQPANGGSAITGYTVTPIKAGVPQAPFNLGLVEDTVVTGLTNGSSYVFTVKAVNAVGTGPASANSNAIVPAPTAPEAPSITSAVGGDASVALSWSAPADNGGSAITGYDVITYNASFVVLKTDHLGVVTSTNVTALANGTPYRFGVRAVNAIGAGDQDFTDEITPAAVVATVPGAPTIGTASINGSTGASVTWTAPASNGGAAITGYVVTPYIGATAQNGLVQNVGVVTNTVVTGLAKGSTYTFKVAAKNSVGTGAQSAASNTVPIPTTAPGAPTGVTGTPGNGQVALQWSAPADNGGSAITHYVVTPYIGAVAQTAITLGTGTSTTVTGLANGTAYTFTVKAQNAIGTGAESAASGSLTPVAVVPGAPGVPIATAGNASVSLTWTAPANDGGSAITGYVVTPFAAGVGQTPIPLGPVFGTTVFGLTNGTSYTFQVHAVNVVGSGPDATSAAVVPRAPTALVITSAPTLATYNKAIKVVGKLTRTDTNAAVAGKVVKLQYRTKGSTGAFSTFATSATSTATGVVTFSTFKPKGPIEVRLSFAASGPFGASTSTSKIVACQLNISISASATSVAVGRTVTLSGAVLPARAGKTIYLQRLSGTSWVTVTSKALTSTSRYSFAVKQTKVGTFKYRVMMKAATPFNQSVSATKSVRVT